MAKGGNSHAAVEEMKRFINNPHTKVREDLQSGVEYPGHKQVEAVIE
jgi:hypothetical protein